MKAISKKITLLLTVLMLVVMNCITVFAEGNNFNSTEAYTRLLNVCRAPWQHTELSKVSGNVSAGYLTGLESKTYNVKDGGYYLYSQITVGDVSENVGNGDVNWIVDDNKFNQLTIGAKQKYLEDLFKVANAVAYATEKGTSKDGNINAGANTETVQQLYQYLETKDGMGSVLMASILQDTKPDFASANKIYAPFSGIVGTVLGLIAVVIMALLGVTMALDIAYIVIPAVQLALDSGEGGGGHVGMGGPGGGGNKGKGLSGLVSQAAKNAVQAAQGGQGAQGQGGDGNKMAVGVYFKYRWLELCVLGICLLYLVSGNIYSFVAWILDLVSGFLGF